MIGIELPVWLGALIWISAAVMAVASVYELLDLQDKDER